MATNNPDIQREAQTVRKQARSILFTGVLIGIGITGFLDETLFHPLL